MGFCDRFSHCVFRVGDAIFCGDLFCCGREMVSCERLENVVEKQYQQVRFSAAEFFCMRIPIAGVSIFTAVGSNFATSEIALQ